jgi:hypothetical protein
MSIHSIQFAQIAPALPEIFVLAMVSLILVIDAAVDDSKRCSRWQELLC